MIKYITKMIIRLIVYLSIIGIGVIIIVAFWKTILPVLFIIIFIILLEMIIDWAFDR